MKTRTTGLIFLFLAVAWISPPTIAQQLVKRMKCADFYITTPIDHRNSSSETRAITVQIVRDSCRPKMPGGYFVLQKTGAGEGNGNYSFTDRYQGYSESITLPFPPGAAVRVLFARPIGDRARGTFDYTYTIN